MRDSLIGTKIGSCTLKRIIGSGGMGTVYEAVQEKPRRRVALKMMKRGITSRSALRRFEFESQVLARLRHPGVAQVYEAGTHDDGTGGVPYFVMEYIPNAKTLTEYADKKNLGTKERLALFSKVCDAVQHGHLKGIVHRDLKPGNILVDSSGHPKVIDFGVARSTDSDMAVTTLQTDVGQLIGTLQYMSPEQCDADPMDIDPRSDVYALGVILYELLTGSLPYDLKQVAIHEAVRIVQEEAPTKLSSINRRLRGDIETISLKALEKERDRRYQSASALAEDLDHYLNEEPIAARGPTVGYLIQKSLVRHKVVARLAFVLGGLALALISMTTMQEFAGSSGASEKEIAWTRVLAEQIKLERLVHERTAQFLDLPHDLDAICEDPALVTAFKTHLAAVRILAPEFRITDSYTKQELEYYAERGHGKPMHFVYNSDALLPCQVLALMSPEPFLPYSFGQKWSLNSWADVEQNDLCREKIEQFNDSEWNVGIRRLVVRMHSLLTNKAGLNLAFTAYDLGIDLNPMLDDNSFQYLLDDYFEKDIGIAEDYEGQKVHLRDVVWVDILGFTHKTIRAWDKLSAQGRVSWLAGLMRLDQKETLDLPPRPEISNYLPGFDYETTIDAVGDSQHLQLFAITKHFRTYWGIWGTLLGCMCLLLGLSIGTGLRFPIHILRILSIPAALLWPIFAVAPLLESRILAVVYLATRASEIPSSFILSSLPKGAYAISLASILMALLMAYVRVTSNTRFHRVIFRCAYVPPMVVVSFITLVLGFVMFISLVNPERTGAISIKDWIIPLIIFLLLTAILVVASVWDRRTSPPNGIALRVFKATLNKLICVVLSTLLLMAIGYMPELLIYGWDDVHSQTSYFVEWCVEILLALGIVLLTLILAYRCYGMKQEFHKPWSSFIEVERQISNGIVWVFLLLGLFFISDTWEEEAQQFAFYMCSMGLLLSFGGMVVHQITCLPRLRLEWTAADSKDVK
jgi:tRNA A-37 threonylcarbamoyl transferase component Bud32